MDAFGGASVIHASRSRGPQGEGVSTAVVLFTRDLRLHDNPALSAGLRDFDSVVPLFVFDPLLFRSSNRLAFLIDAIEDLDTSLGGRLVTRVGDPATEVLRVAAGAGAEAVEVMADASAYARRREGRLSATRLRVRSHPGVGVLETGRLTPTGSDHYAVFTPYYHRWRTESWRTPGIAPHSLAIAGGIESAARPGRPAGVSVRLPPGGETAGRRRLREWVSTGILRYRELGDDLGADATSRLSPYLHFGCISPLELATRSRETEGPGAEAFLRQLCWRDFHLQVLAVRPDLARSDYRPRGDQWSIDQSGFERWKEGRTGFPLVDAAMRQLLAEGWIANRARLVAASFLVKDLHLDWRLGLDHFDRWLVDGDLASNAGNWQWIAGTGNDSRPNRVLNPDRQAQRFDPDGQYARRHLPEFGTADYPPPMLNHAVAAARFIETRRRAG